MSDKSKKLGAGLLAVVYVYLQLTSFNAWADEPVRNITLSIKPDRCVALHQGQDCYQHIVIAWRSAQLGDFCLVDSQTRKELKCWENSTEGVYRFDFQSSTSSSYVLHSMPVGKAIAHAEMQVAWVYKARKRQRLNWRLF